MAQNMIGHFPKGVGLGRRLYFVNLRMQGGCVVIFADWSDYELYELVLSRII
jgi:hypothetical protein